MAALRVLGVVPSMPHLCGAQQWHAVRASATCALQPCLGAQLSLAPCPSHGPQGALVRTASMADSRQMATSRTQVGGCNCCWERTCCRGGAWLLLGCYWARKGATCQADWPTSAMLPMPGWSCLRPVYCVVTAQTQAGMAAVAGAPQME